MQLIDGPPDQQPPPNTSQTKDKPKTKGSLLYWLSGIAVAAISAFFAQGSTPIESTSQQLFAAPGPIPNPRILKVVLFSYLPKQTPKYTQFIQEGFNSLYPNLANQVKFSLDTDKSLYDLSKLKPKLQSGEFAMAEIDTILLGDIKDSISKWQLKSQDQFFKSAIQSSKIGSDQFGIPRLQCSSFLFTKNKQLAFSKSYDDFRKNFDYTKGFAYHLNDRFDFINYFHNFLALNQDANQDDLLKQFVSLNIEKDVIANLNQICDHDNLNQCLLPSSTYNPKDIITGKLDALVGYYEVASSFTKEELASLHIVPMLSWMKPMLVQTDILVRSSDLTPEEQAITDLVAQFLTDKDLIKALLEGKDLGDDQLPRYVMPAINNVLDDLASQDDIFRPSQII